MCRNRGVKIRGVKITVPKSRRIQPTLRRPSVRRETGNAMTQTAPITESAPAAPVETTEDETVVVADLLVEEVSIDGMCGVY
jgi:mycofactocin precursor